jgi:hypothetical protein
VGRGRLGRDLASGRHPLTAHGRLPECTRCTARSRPWRPTRYISSMSSADPCVYEGRTPPALVPGRAAANRSCELLGCVGREIPVM